ncbi:MAG: VOC family protein [Chloroflexota bacterium]|nr:VOC family protein [Chloroflexota bacterium]
MKEGTITMLLGLNFVMLHVPDVEKARAFYIEKLGLVIEDEQPDFVQFKQPHGNGATFALDKGEDAATLQGAELWWFVDDADATCSELVARNVEIVSKPHDEPFGRAFAIKDPAGHTIHMLQLSQASS